MPYKIISQQEIKDRTSIGIVETNSLGTRMLCKKKIDSFKKSSQNLIGYDPLYNTIPQNGNQLVNTAIFDCMPIRVDIRIYLSHGYKTVDHNFTFISYPEVEIWLDNNNTLPYGYNIEFRLEIPGGLQGLLGIDMLGVNGTDWINFVATENSNYYIMQFDGTLLIYNNITCRVVDNNGSPKSNYKCNVFVEDPIEVYLLCSLSKWGTDLRWKLSNTTQYNYGTPIESDKYYFDVNYLPVYKNGKIIDVEMTDVMQYIFDGVSVIVHGWYNEDYYYHYPQSFDEEYFEEGPRVRILNNKEIESNLYSVYDEFNILMYQSEITDIETNRTPDYPSVFIAWLGGESGEIRNY